MSFLSRKKRNSTSAILLKGKSPINTRNIMQMKPITITTRMSSVVCLLRAGKILRLNNEISECHKHLSWCREFQSASKRKWQGWNCRNTVDALKSNPQSIMSQENTNCLNCNEHAGNQFILSQTRESQVELQTLSLTTKWSIILWMSGLLNKIGLEQSHFPA